MTMSVPSVERLRRQVLEEIRAFKQNLQRLEALDFSNPAPLDLIKELRKEIKTEEETIDTLKYFADSEDRARQLLANSHRKIAARIPFLGHIERAQTHHTPWSLVESVQDLAGAIIPEYRVIIASVDAHNYLVEWDPDDKRLFLWLPRLHRLNALWHTNIGHEIFHPALDQFFIKQLPTVAPQIATACRRLQDSLNVASPEPPLFAQRRLDHYVGETLAIWKRGLEELICDFGCASIFGPAAMMALLSMANCDNLDTCPDAPQYYPPWRFRFRMVHQRIGERVREFVEEQAKTAPSLAKYFEAFSRSLDSFQAVTKAEGDMQQINADPLCGIAYEQIRASVDAGWEYVQACIPQNVRRWSETKEQVAALVARIEAGIPPSELAKEGDELCPQAADFSAILVAGWVYESFWQLQEEEDRKYDYSTLMRLILKACEDAALRRAYMRRRGEGQTE